MRNPTLEQMNYHGVRLLILVAYCGTPARSPRIKGRTLLAKLDFFLRYPVYLDKAVRIRKGKSLGELIDEDLKVYERDNVETRMIRYKYGPWDKIYYSVLAYLIAKDLIDIEMRKEIEYFGLTESGTEVVEAISGNAAFQTLVARARVLKKIFPHWNGTSIKDFIYENYPEIVSLPLGKEI